MSSRIMLKLNAMLNVKVVELVVVVVVVVFFISLQNFYGEK